MKEEEEEKKNPQYWLRDEQKCLKKKGLKRRVAKRGRGKQREERREKDIDE